MNVKTKPLHQLNEEAIQVLIQELGVADTARFIRQFSTGAGDYTEERRERLAEMSLDEVIDEVKKHREGGNA